MAVKTHFSDKNARKEKGFHRKNKELTDYQRERLEAENRPRRKHAAQTVL